MDDQTTSIADKKLALLIVLALLPVFVLTSPGTMQSLDEQILYDATVALSRGALAIAHPAGVTGQGGLLYSKYGIGLPMIALPFYAMGILLARVLPFASNDLMARFITAMVNPVISALTAAAIFLLCLHLFRSRRKAIALAFTWALATFAWHYTQTFFTEPAIAFGLVASFYFLVRFKQTGHDIDAYLAGFFFGLMLLVKPSAIASGAGVILYLAVVAGRNKRYADIYRFAMPVAIACGVIIIHNWLRFGAVLDFGYGREGFTNPILVGLHGFLLSPGKSIFLYAPVLILSIPGLIKMFKANRDEAIAITACLLANLLFYSGWAGWDGWFWGPRYMTIILPLAIVAIGALPIGQNRALRYAAYILVGLSLLMQLYSLPVSAQRFYYQAYMDNGATHMERTQFNWRYSPLVCRADEIAAVISNTRDPKRLKDMARKRDISDSGKGQEYFFANNINYQAPNFWWYYLYILDFPKVLITTLVILLLLLTISILIMIRKILNQIGHYKYK